MRSKIGGRIADAVDRSSSFLYVLSHSALASMAALVFASVVMRYVFKSPWFWAEQINAYMLIFMAFGTIAELMRKREHISFTLLSQRWTGRRAVAVDLVILSFALFWWYFVIWKTFRLTVTSYRYQIAESSLLATPLYIIYSFLLIGLFFLGLQFIILFVKDVHSLTQKGGS